MRKCAVVIETSQGKLIVPVENFSKENVIKSLAKTISVDADKIEQTSVSANYGIYGIKEKFPSVQKFKTSTSPFFYSNEHDAAFIVHYAYLTE